VKQFVDQSVRDELTFHGDVENFGVETEKAIVVGNIFTTVVLIIVAVLVGIVLLYLVYIWRRECFCLSKLLNVAASTEPSL
jgi:hypothetical protein